VDLALNCEIEAVTEGLRNRAHVRKIAGFVSTMRTLVVLIEFMRTLVVLTCPLSQLKTDWTERK